MSKRSIQKGDIIRRSLIPVLLLALFGFIYLPFISLGVEIPEMFNYQGLLLNSVGNPLPDGEYGVQFSIFDAEEGGILLWGPQVCEGVNDPENGLYPKVLVKNGEFHLVLGPKDTDGDEISKAFTSDDTWLQIEVTIDKDGSPVTDGIIKPRQRFLSAPYAFYSRRIPMVDPDINTKIIDVEDGFNINASQDGSLRATLIGKDYGGELKCYHTNGKETLMLRGGKSGYTGGRFDIRDINEQNLITMWVQGNGNPEQIMYRKNGYHGVINNVNDSGGIIKCYNGNGDRTAQMYGYGAYGGAFDLYNHDGSYSMGTLQAWGNNYLCIHDRYGTRAVVLSGLSDSRGYLSLKRNEVDQVVLYPGYFQLKNDSGITEVKLYNDPIIYVYNNGQFLMKDNSGNTRIYLHVDTDNRGYVHANQIVAEVIYAGTKYFQIPHPTKPGMVLTHACIEGPETAVYYRGEAQLKDGATEIALPEYFEALTRKEDRTVQLTCKNGWSPIFYEDIIDGKFKVKTTDQGNPSQKFSWEVKAIRADVDLLKTEQPEKESKVWQSLNRMKQESKLPDENIQTNPIHMDPNQ